MRDLKVDGAKNDDLYINSSKGEDWGGFNIPFNVALDCYENIEHETPYDKAMNDIINDIKSMM